MPDAAPTNRRARAGARDVVGRPGVVLACGLATLDVVQTVDHVPARNEKLVAGELLVSAGGPAANGAATAALLGVPARLVTRIGGGALGSVVAADLRACGVDVTDLAPPAASPPVSTVLVTRSTGERAVVSVNATGFEAASGAGGSVDSAGLGGTAGSAGTAGLGGTAGTAGTEGTDGPLASEGVWADVVVVLLDGHHLDLAEACAREARARGVLVLLDGGSWKPGLERVLPFVDVAVLSADFTVPGEGLGDDLLRAVRAAGPAVVAQSHGPGPVRVLTDDGTDDVRVPAVAVVDTLGAGDVLHGALAAWLAVRTSGMGSDTGSDAASDAGPDNEPDAGSDAGPDNGPDAGPDAGPDNGPDAGSDAGPPASSSGGSGAGTAADPTGRESGSVARGGRHSRGEPRGGRRLSPADAAAGLSWAAALASASCAARGSRGWATDAGRLARWRAGLHSV